MTSDLVIHVVGSKLDLADKSRAVSLEEAQATVRGWLAPAAASTPVRPQPARGTSAARALAKFGSGSAVRRSGEDEPAAPEPTWRDVEVSEVSAKSDTGASRWRADALTSQASTRRSSTRAPRLSCALTDI